MFDVIYITPSDRMALEYIRRLRGKLEERNIAMDEINMWRMKIRVGNATVHVKNLFAGNLFLSHSRVEYFVDGVSECVKNGICVPDGTNKMLGALKSRFPSWAKEISEEELIEILRGKEK